MRKQIELVGDNGDRVTVVVEKTQPDQALYAWSPPVGGARVSWPVRHSLTDAEWQRAKAIAER